MHKSLIENCSRLAFRQAGIYCKPFVMRRLFLSRNYFKKSIKKVTKIFCSNK